jgi:tetratricopeptide (TPR) repeat protein
VSISGELERARQLTSADDEVAAKELLLTLLPQIEAAGRDDWALEDLAQLGELYLIRTAYDGVRESARRIRECLAIYLSVLDGTATDDITAQVTMSVTEIEHLVARYSRRALFLETGLAAAIGDHTGAAHLLADLDGSTSRFDDMASEFALLRLRARIECAKALCDDDLHVRSEPLWRQVIDGLDAFDGDPAEADRVRVMAALGYARFCIETGRRAEAEPWLRRAGARATARGWPLVTARTQLERATASWQAGDHVTTERLVNECYPVIAQYARADDVSRCWLYLGLTRLAAGGLQAADECWEHAERHWRELGKPLHIHRILLQRSWIAIFRGRYDDAVSMVDAARECLDSTPRSSWLAYARLDDHLGTIWRADALGDLGFDGAGDPEEEWTEAEARYEKSLGVIDGEAGTPAYARAMTKLNRAAELKIPAALAVDSVRYSITDAEARAQWGRCVSAPLLASAFAVAWELENDELVASLIEYHSARGTFAAELPARDGLEFSRVATAAAPVSDLDELAMVASAPGVDTAPSLTRLGPLPPLRMDPTAGPLLAQYRELAMDRYGQRVTAPEPAWSTWP